MARQSRTFDPTARTGRADSAHALSQLARMTNVARKNGRIAGAAAGIARAREYRLQLPAEASVLKDVRLFGEASLLGRRTPPDGSGGDSGGGLSWDGRDRPGNTASAGTGGSRATALADTATRSHRPIPELSQAMKALARIERSVELGSAGRFDARRYATPQLGSNSDSTGRGLESREAKEPSLETGILASVRVARSIRGVIPPASVSQREFAQPSGNMRVSNFGSGRGTITINSSPTVVINAPASGAVQHDVIGALRAHREELFDQLKRESARRERTQF
jgi:hypothetical protein